MRGDDKEERNYFWSANRFFQASDEWWFSSREGDHDPFASRADAEEAFRTFLAMAQGDASIDKLRVLGKNEKSAWDLRHETRY
ncbi:MAG: DUF6316 family protein [Pseudomonadales bacterium]|jgi:hypothetical protein|nr:DUF6316 family protein [Pseudomonadales bacterium]MDP6471915.1 DUF6316 family protein [Pseudomonadales bacterium]MDP6826815.1 DUF6316 family protein [Pseudomonadales bacterium]MDP6970907.1 DUF6316 family protein [Pseudomonadales bacterium]|tara:strand:+ start:4280 stop:4528 length:249 start_codon:yes stop_codon:yes gene_type:complete